MRHRRLRLEFCPLFVSVCHPHCSASCSGPDLLGRMRQRLPWFDLFPLLLLLLYNWVRALPDRPFRSQSTPAGVDLHQHTYEIAWRRSAALMSPTHQLDRCQVWCFTPCLAPLLLVLPLCSVVRGCMGLKRGGGASIWLEGRVEDGLCAGVVAFATALCKSVEV